MTPKFCLAKTAAPEFSLANHASVQNNGGWAPATTNILVLPDGRRIEFPLDTPDPMQWATNWLAENEPNIALHPDFVVTL
jgi:hypothetical protein